MVLDKGREGRGRGREDLLWRPENSLTQMVDATSFLSMVALATLASVLSALVPLLWYRNGLKKRTLHTLLGLSAGAREMERGSRVAVVARHTHTGILFALATVDLIPEGMAVSSMRPPPASPPLTLAPRDAKAQPDESFADILQSTAVGGLHAAARAHEHNTHEHSDGHDHEDAHAALGRRVTMVGVGVGFFALVLLEHAMLSLGVEHSHATGDESEGDHSGHAHSHTHKKSDATGLSERCAWGRAGGYSWAAEHSLRAQLLADRVCCHRHALSGRWCGDWWLVSCFFCHWCACCARYCAPQGARWLCCRVAADGQQSPTQVGLARCPVQLHPTWGGAGLLLADGHTVVSARGRVG